MVVTIKNVNEQNAETYNQNTIKENKGPMPSNNLLESVNFEFNGYNGKDYWQHQGNDDNCAITSLLVAVNMLLGENRYTNNVSEWYISEPSAASLFLKIDFSIRILPAEA